MNGTPRPHPAQVPTLTEIVDLQAPEVKAPPPAPPQGPPGSLDALPVLGEVVTAAVALKQPATVAAAVAIEVAAPPAADTNVPLISESQLAHRVLSDVQRQVDSMLDFRLKEAMGPLLARHTEAIARDLRDELNKTLKDVVARSVAQELAKLRQR